MTTINSVNTTLSGQSGTGAFAGTNSAILTTPVIGTIKDVNGNNILLLNPTSSATNYVQINNNTTNPQIIAAGSGTLGLDIVTQSGAFRVYVDGATNQVEFLTGQFNQHTTTFSFPSTADSNTVTFPDVTGTALLTAGTQALASGASLTLDKGTGTESSNAVTISKQAGVITTVGLTTTQFNTETITLTNTLIGTSSVVIASIMGGSNTTPGVTVSATAGSGTSTIVLTNTNSAALNGTVIIGFAVF